MKRKIFLLTVLLLLGTVTMIGQETQIQKTVVIEDNNDITKRKLYEQIIKFGIKFPDIVFAQAMIESDGLTSKLFKLANNMFGMKFPSIRETTAYGKTSSGYSKYHDWNFGVYDYFLWQEYMLRKRSEITKNQYFALLDRVYAEDPKYVAKIKRKIVEYQHIFN